MKRTIPSLVGLGAMLFVSVLLTVIPVSASLHEVIVSDSTWKTNDSAPVGWNEISFDDTGWRLSNAPWPGFLAWYSPINSGMWDPDDLDWGQYSGGYEAYFRKEFTLNGIPLSAVFQINVDNCYELYINGMFVGSDDNWRDMETYDVMNFLRWGENITAQGLAAIL